MAKCLRCDHVWDSQVLNPKMCPKCKSPYWNKPRRIEIVSHTKGTIKNIDDTQIIDPPFTGMLFGANKQQGFVRASELRASEIKPVSGVKSVMVGDTRFIEFPAQLLFKGKVYPNVIEEMVKFRVERGDSREEAILYLLGLGADRFMKANQNINLKAGSISP